MFGYWTRESAGKHPRPAWKWLGHIAHLVSGVTLPAHVLLSDHRDGEEYESYMDRAVLTRWPARLDVMPPTYSSLNDLFHKTAEFTDNYDSDRVNGRADADGPRVARTCNGKLTTADCAKFADVLYPRAILAVESLIKMNIDKVRPTLVA